MSRESAAGRAERELLLADLEALQRRRDRAEAELAPVRRDLQREVELAREAAGAADAADRDFGDAAARVKALEERVDATRREAAAAASIAASARQDLAREAAAAHGLLARIVTVANATSDADLRKWARRLMTSGDAP